MGKAVLPEPTSFNVYDLVEAMDEDDQEWLPLQSADEAIVQLIDISLADKTGKRADSG